ncbi:hypothetical protein GW17_00029158 [Ensete ventricosum]|nr:hypothetical protein GW17_00029158 [Ensete ventricosum]
MPARRVVQIGPDDQNSQKWRVPFTEDAFRSFIVHSGVAGRKVFGEGSLFSPLLFGKFFDPADAFPLWEFESDAKCDVDVCNLKEMVVEISGRWRGRETDTKDWKNGRWWENGFARRLELPEDANWTKMEAYITDDIFLEMRIPKSSSDIDLQQMQAV